MENQEPAEPGELKPKTNNGEPENPKNAANSLKGGSRLLKTALALLFIALVLEIAARLLFPASVFKKATFEAGGGFLRMSENAQLVYEPVPGAGENNSYGHRGPDHPFSETKKTRLVFLGGSNAEASGLPVSARFSEKLGALYGSRFDFINLGVFGYDFFQQAEYFKTLALKFSPGTVIWLLDEDSLGPTKNAASEFITKSQHGLFYISYYKASGLGLLLFKSRLYRLGRYVLSGKAGEKELARLESVSSPALIIRQMEHLKMQASRQKVNLVFVLLPSQAKTESLTLDMLRRILAREAVSFFDLDALVKANLSQDRLPELFRGNDPALLSAVGQDVLAKAISALAEEVSRR